MCLVTTVVAVAAAVVVGEVAVAVVVAAMWEEFAAEQGLVAAVAVLLLHHAPSTSTLTTPSLFPSLSLQPSMPSTPPVQLHSSTSFCRRTRCKSSGRVSEEPKFQSGRP